MGTRVGQARRGTRQAPVGRRVLDSGTIYLLARRRSRGSSWCRPRERRRAHRGAPRRSPIIDGTSRASASNVFLGDDGQARHRARDDLRGRGACATAGSGSSAGCSEPDPGGHPLDRSRTGYRERMGDRTQAAGRGCRRVPAHGGRPRASRTSPTTISARRWIIRSPSSIEAAAGSPA